MTASPPPPSVLEWSLVRQIQMLKTCQGLKRGQFNLCKAVWALSPLCSGDVERLKKNNIQVKRRRKKNTTTAAGDEVLVWAAADLHVSQQDKLQDLPEMQQLKEKKMIGTCFYGPLPLLTHTRGKIHPRKTIPASAQLNQQRKSVRFPVRSLWLL